MHEQLADRCMQLKSTKKYEKIIRDYSCRINKLNKALFDAQQKCKAYNDKFDQLHKEISILTFRLDSWKKYFVKAIQAVKENNMYKELYGELPKSERE